MSDNPYSPPSMLAPFTSEPAAEIASQGKRFLNTIIDNIILQFVGAAAGFVLGFSYVAIKGGVITPNDQLMLQIIGWILGVTVAMSYYISMECLFQRTIAKFITNTKVVRDDGTPPNVSQIVGRSFARLIPFEAFSFLGGQNPVGWHDSFSGTRVVRAS